MLNSSVGATGEWLSAGGENGFLQKLCSSFCGDTVHISFPHLQTPTEECKNSVFFCY